MIRNFVKKCFVLLIGIFMICFSTISIAHSGRTDSNGGHRDNKNKSGLGSYHYHCDGNPAHLHTNGYCPYSSNNDILMLDEEESITNEYEYRVLEGRLGVALCLSKNGYLSYKNE